MNISATGNNSLLESVLQAESTRVEIGVAVLKKAKDAQEQQGEAMIKLREAAAPARPGFNAYA